MSTRPNSDSAREAIASTWSRLATSVTTASALTPRSRASRATDSASCWFERALTTTCAPSPASFSTVARPILRPEPVTSATFPSSLPMSHLHLRCPDVAGIRIPWQRETGWFVRSEYPAALCVVIARSAATKQSRRRREGGWCDERAFRPGCRGGAADVVCSRAGPALPADGPGRGFGLGGAGNRRSRADRCLGHRAEHERALGGAR